MTYSAIDDPSKHFQVNSYSGSSNPQTITNGGNSDLQPDFLWSKRQDAVAPHYLFNSTTGVNASLNSDATDAESGTTTYLASFDSDGFTTGSDSALAYSGRTYVAWQWKANGGTTTSVSGTGTSAGSTKAGTYQANTTAGFSIVTFSTGADDNGDHRIEHGLGAVPHFIITKERDGTYDWYTYHHNITDDNDYLRLNLTNATSNAGARNVFDGSDFTSTYFEMDNNNIVNDSKTYVAYCFTEIQGYSKFGRYTGNGSTNGPFNYCGFKPAMVMWKMTSSSGDWDIYDTARDTYNPAIKELLANATNAESSSSVLSMDILSNGFKLRTTNANGNANDGVYVFAAFAENPFVTSGGVPCTAR